MRMRHGLPQINASLPTDLADVVGGLLNGSNYGARAMTFEEIYGALFLLGMHVQRDQLSRVLLKLLTVAPVRLQCIVGVPDHYELVPEP